MIAKGILAITWEFLLIDSTLLADVSRIDLSQVMGWASHKNSKDGIWEDYYLLLTNWLNFDSQNYII